MQPVATPFFFYLLSALAVVSGLLVITRKNPVHSAIFLVVTLLSLAGLYLMLYAPFVAGVQIVVYVGGIMVLFLFVIMLVSVEQAQKEHRFNKQWHVATAAALVLGAMFVLIYYRGNTLLATHPVLALPETSNTQDVGKLLYQDYMMPFEVASVLLLVAIVGAVVMAKKRI